MKRSVYIETTVISYLTSWPCRDLVRLSQQQTTREWWDKQKPLFDCFVSVLVLQEAERGDPSAASERLRAIQGLAILDATPEADALAAALLTSSALPAKSAADALHISIAATNGVEFVLTWNCRHMANAIMQPRIMRVCDDHGVRAPIICTPETLMEDEL